MTSQFMSFVEYLIPTDNIAVLLLQSNLIKSSLMDGFSIRFNDNSEAAFSLSHPEYVLDFETNKRYHYAVIDKSCEVANRASLS